jgi:hypothetical protein
MLHAVMIANIVPQYKLLFLKEIFLIPADLVMPGCCEFRTQYALFSLSC